MKRQKRESFVGKRKKIEISSSEEESFTIEKSSEESYLEATQKLQAINDSKKKFFKQITSGRLKKNLPPDQKMKQLIQIAENLVNFLLTRKTHQENQQILRDSKRKQNQTSEILEEDPELQEEIVYLQEQPSILKNGILKDHQLVGLNWLISMYSIGFNGILADEMGLGKTIQTIALFAYLLQFKNIKGPHLVVCPNSVVSNWKKEFSKWLPNLRVVKLIPRKEYRFDIIKEFIQPRKFDVIITSYEGVSICRNVLQKIHWKYVIVDEAHRIKNEQSLLSQNLRTFKTDLKLLITGTPLQNNLKELWALLNFIMPELFDDQSLFEDYNDKEENLTQEEIEKKNLELISSLHKILRPFLLKRTKAVIDKSIPPKKEIHIFVGLTKLQTQIYKNLLLKKAPTVNSTKTSLQNVLMHLRKVCNHPYLFEGVEDPSLPPLGDHIVKTSGKMMLIDKLLEKLKYNHQVLIFSQFTSMLDIIEDYLIYKKFEYCRIDGSTFLDEREEQIQQFTKPNSTKYVFLLSTRAGGLGINLTTADTVILYDSDWNPQVDLQAMDRAHRIGQTKCVNVYRLITEHTIEEKIIERQRVKLKWDHLVILKGKVSQKKRQLGKNELQDLIQFGSNAIFKATDGTFKNEDLDLILQRGEQKTLEMNKKIDEFMNKKGDNLLDLGINSINIYQFEGDDYQEKRKKDREIILENQLIYFQRDKLQKRSGKLQSQKVEKVPQKIVQLPYYHFYDDVKKLEVLLSDEANGKELSNEDQKLKQKLMKTGFPEFSKNDFYCIIRGLEKYDQEDFESFAELLDKDVKAVKAFMKKMMKNIDNLNEGSRILKNIEKMKKNEENRIESETIVRKKCKSIKKFTDLQFDDSLYSKIKSKFYTQLQDKFLLYQAYIHGPKNFKQIKIVMMKEKIFMFDFFLKSIKESLLGKRIASLIKMVKNEQLQASEKQQLKKEVVSQKKPKKAKIKKKQPKSPKKKPKSLTEAPSKEDQDIENNQVLFQYQIEVNLI